MEEPFVWANHNPATQLYQLLISNSKKTARPSFLFTFVRDPLQRCISEYYHFQVTRKGASESDANVVAFLRSKAPNFIYDYIRPTADHLLPTQLFDYYDHIGVVERFDESLVILAEKLRLPLKDVLYMTSKNSSSSNGQRSHQHQPTPGVRQSLEAMELRALYRL